MQIEELEQLLSSPREDLDIECKEWLNLDEAVNKANIARHIAALANHGGGVIIFGVTDDLKLTSDNPHSCVVDRDVISGIVKRYLEPAFQCDVVCVKSGIGSEHPVIIVPPHGAAPICAKRSGPSDQGIRQGIYYIRKPGPESAQPLTASEWAPLIRRCATHDRASILAAIDTALQGGNTAGKNEVDLRTWHAAAKEAFLQSAKAVGREDLVISHWQLSYAINTNESRHVEHSALLEMLRQIGNETATVVGESDFFQSFRKYGHEPRFATDAASGLGDLDFLERKVLHPDVFFGELWRVSVDGKATTVQGYWEDEPTLNETLSRSPGSWFSPNIMLQKVAEMVCHARAMAERFETARSVSFRTEWYGLNGRVLYSTESYWSHGVASSDQRVGTFTAPITALAGSWTEIVAKLVAPTMRAFRTDEIITPAYVQGHAAKWSRFSGS
jgi:hypothetical protein